MISFYSKILDPLMGPKTMCLMLLYLCVLCSLCLEGSPCIWLAPVFQNSAQTFPLLLISAQSTLDTRHLLANLIALQLFPLFCSPVDSHLPEGKACVSSTSDLQFLAPHQALCGTQECLSNWMQMKSSAVLGQETNKWRGPESRYSEEENDCNCPADWGAGTLARNLLDPGTSSFL